MMRNFFGTLGLVCKVFSAPCHASVVYEFSFDNVQNGGGVVDGTITLPSSADGTYSATSVIVTTNPQGYGLGQYVGHPDANIFTISGGSISGATFESFGIDNSACCSLGLFSTDAGLTQNTNSITFGENDPVTYALQATPLPPALLLFASALALIGVLGCYERHKARAIAT